MSDTHQEHVDDQQPREMPEQFRDYIGALGPMPSRGDNFVTLGKLETELGLKPRHPRSFKTHADHQNYLYGRSHSAD